jgi:hypothetical protein
VTRVRRLVATTLLAAAAVASPAAAADVGPQTVRVAPARFPNDIPGCVRPRCAQGRVIPRGWVLLTRRVRLARGERRAAVRFTCPGRNRFVTFGFAEPGGVLVQIPDDQIPYTRRRTVRVVAERGVPSRRGRGAIYAVCR